MARGWRVEMTNTFRAAALPVGDVYVVCVGGRARDEGWGLECLGVGVAD